jgi:hypothetical protein
VIKEHEEEEILQGLNNYLNHCNRQDGIPSPDSIKVSPIDMTFSPFTGPHTMEVVVSPYEFNSPRGKLLAAHAGISIEESEISEKKVRNFSNIRATPLKINTNKPKSSSNKKKPTENIQVGVIFKEFQELKNKYSKLEKELEEVKKIKSSTSTTTNRNTRKKKEISEDEKLSLVAEINKLSLEDKKQMRVVIKDYIKIFSDGQFEFNINSLPRETFDELKKYVDNCLKSKGGRFTVKTKEEDSKENKNITNKNEKLGKNNEKDGLSSPRGSTVESDGYIPSEINQNFIRAKRNRLIFDDSGVSSSKECKN